MANQSIQDLFIFLEFFYKISQALQLIAQLKSLIQAGFPFITFRNQRLLKFASFLHVFVSLREKGIFMCHEEACGRLLK